MLRAALWLGLSVLLYGTADAATVSKDLTISVTHSGGGNKTITSLTFPSNASFQGGAPDGTIVGNISVVTSDGSVPNLSLIGQQVGSGNDADSFQMVGKTITVHTAAGATDQPGQYSVCVVASGPYSNSPQQACGVIQATGAGGAGWQLTFSDEFVCPNNMLQCAQLYPVASYAWSNTACAGLVSGAASGCGVVTTSSPIKI
jgi:hypothetical protein